MTTTQLVLSMIAIAVAIINPWLVARWSKKAQTDTAPFNEQKIKWRKLNSFLDWALLVASLFALASFFLTQRPLDRVSVVLIAVCSTIFFSAVKTITKRIGWF
jgi:divalent metal cation (Fe/Co/Zn/Cd) transporter